MVALSALTGCAVAKDPYLAGHVGRATEREVLARLGEPLFMLPGEGGGVRWIYREGDIWVTKQPAQGRAASDCLEYHLTFDSRKVLTDWTKAAC